jgi:HD-like signal output (HDOD) protein
MLTIEDSFEIIIKGMVHTFGKLLFAMYIIIYMKRINYDRDR